MRTRCNGSTRATVRARRIGKRRKALRACERKDEPRCLRGRVARGERTCGCTRGHVARAGGRAGCGRKREGGAGRSRTQTVLLARNAQWAFRLVRNSVRDQPAPPSWELRRTARDEQQEGSPERGDRKGHRRRTIREITAKSLYRTRKEFEPIQAAESILTNPPRARSARGEASGHNKEHKSARAPLVPDLAPPLGQAALWPRSAQNKGQDRAPEGPAASASC